MAQKNSKNKKKLFFGSAFSALAVLLTLIFGNSQNNYIAESAENIFYDQFFKWTTEVIDSTGEKDGVIMESTPYNDQNIIIADIDEKSLLKFGHYYNWDRSIHAKVIENLGEGGAAAIAFDILFKDADFGKRKGEQCQEILKQLDPDTSHVKLFTQIHSYYNYDSMLVEATRNSNICIVSFLLNDTTHYRNKSDWYNLSTWERAKEVGFSSTFELNQADKPQEIESRPLLDNVFPELANAGTRVGAVNAYPDNDGTIRRINLLYKFPRVKEDKLAPQRIYGALSLMTILHLFHKDPKDIQIKMGKYIDIGKPFGIYRDSVGEYHTTFPNFTYPMFLSLRDKMKQIKESGVQKASQVETSYKTSVSRNNDGQIVFNIFVEENQHLSATLSNVLRKLPENIFDKLKTSESVELDSGFTMTKSDETEGVYVIKNEDDDENYITPSVLKTIHLNEYAYKDLKIGEHKHLSRSMDISYDKAKNKWSASIHFFTNQILQDISNASDQQIASIKPGEELRFGPYKRIPINDHGRFLIKYKGRFNDLKPETRAFKHISYYDIYRDHKNLDQYAGKTVILGSSVSALFDIVNGPHEENIPAILVHANIIKNVLEDDYMTILNENYQRIAVIVLAIICMLIGVYFRSFVSLILTIGIAVLYTLFAYICFKHNIYIGVSKQLLAIITPNIIAMVVQAYFENKEKKFIESSFKQYISPELIDEMVAEGNMPELGGEESNITAYFTDIQGFSTFSEKIGSASKLVELLNEYLTAMTDVLTTKNKGTLDKYEGDAIIAFFGAPMKYDDHARRACNTALDMQSELLRLRKKWFSEGNKWPDVVHNMHMRIGINTGNIVTGNMGSTMRKNYTMMGDEVNLAARLESAAKQYGAYIHVCKNTIDQLTEQNINNQYIYRSLDIIRVVGKDEPVETFELLAYASDANALVLKKLCELWKEARAAYLDMQWDKAIALFTQCLDFEPHLPERDPGSKTCPSQVYIKRCMAYKQNPPAHAGEKWDGIFTATEK
ncbi:adenylate/guanylate cyclase domain protein [Fibrobacter succinogenes subsp. succinogenes S85]|uniref:Adenylate/guanylate cyclase domain protein n=1 Tax=Fibrobacter succinogenes (strain ATCC 19169 / S85) TaxID=59374 RepID=C9RLK3_FIBSS|nr:CHASE2 domain-containing protein [Fibrobacter succinogenes]ACX76018.1 adenylate/guanylate cyclase with Chase sensor [Fibrobacter succinogenes subsp. succinogenes S85]ADL24912.1 adenylate/guanylate cyclase domain protein [Fibrobacter succinogenes subsp. succinogenes S85]